VFGWALFSGFGIARSIHRTGDHVSGRGDGNEAVVDPRPDDVHAAKTPWDNLLRIEQLEAEEPHPLGTAKLADQFQAAVGTLIGMEAPGLAGREPAATFTKTAESRQPLAGRASRSDLMVETAPEKGDAIASPARGAGNIAREMVTQAAGHVDGALKSIPAIAERINPPALAAVIAAVRAGEAGKGYAVVAQELTVLTSQTTKVLEQLGIQIGVEATTHDPYSSSKKSRQDSGASERAHRHLQPQGKSRTRYARRLSPRPRRRRSELT
jgi:hypothetical protein